MTAQTFYISQKQRQPMKSLGSVGAMQSTYSLAWTASNVHKVGRLDDEVRFTHDKTRMGRIRILCDATRCGISASARMGK